MDYLKIASIAQDTDNQLRALVACHIKARSIKNNPQSTAAQVAWADKVRRTGDLGTAYSNLLFMAMAAQPSLLADFNTNGTILVAEDAVAADLQTAVDAVVDNDLAPYETV